MSADCLDADKFILVARATFLGLFKMSDGVKTGLRPIIRRWFLSESAGIIAF